MRISQRRIHDAAVIDVADELTYGTRKALSNHMESARQQGCRHVILNMREVTFLDSAAIGLLALTAQQFKAANLRLSLAGPQGTVKQLLDLSNISKLIPVYPTEESALQGLAA